MISHKLIAVSSLTAALAACSSSSSMTTAPADDSGGPLETSNPSPEGSTDTGAKDAGSATAVIGALSITTS
jgi:hypothetical protein